MPVRTINWSRGELSSWTTRPRASPVAAMSPRAYLKCDQLRSTCHHGAILPASASSTPLVRALPSPESTESTCTATGNGTPGAMIGVTLAATGAGKRS
jgi:hypothetical protein